MLCSQLSYLVCGEGVEGGADGRVGGISIYFFLCRGRWGGVHYELKGRWPRLFLGWGGQGIQPQGALTWLA